MGDARRSVRQRGTLFVTVGRQGEKQPQTAAGRCQPGRWPLQTAAPAARDQPRPISGNSPGRTTATDPKVLACPGLQPRLGNKRQVSCTQAASACSMSRSHYTSCTCQHPSQTARVGRVHALLPSAWQPYLTHGNAPRSNVNFSAFLHATTRRHAVHVRQRRPLARPGLPQTACSPRPPTSPSVPTAL